MPSFIVSRINCGVVTLVGEEDENLVEIPLSFFPYVENKNLEVGCVVELSVRLDLEKQKARQKQLEDFQSKFLKG